MKKRQMLKLLIVFIALLLPILGYSSAAATSPTVSSAYGIQGTIQPGSLVSLVQVHGSIVESANSSNSTSLIGISVAANTSLLEINSSANTVQVATDGTASTLVSTINGSINVGDQVGVSPINGIGMRVSPSTRVIGIAQSTFSSSSTGATAEQVTDSKGKTKTIEVGYIPIGIAIGTSNQGTQQQTGLQKLAKNFLGHPISNTRIIVALIIAAIAMASIISLIYASIYSTIISIGRNPLAKFEVMRTLMTVMGMVLIIASISCLIIYLLLR
jgi:hypothetical protein